MFTVTICRAARLVCITTGATVLLLAMTFVRTSTARAGDPGSGSCNPQLQTCGVGVGGGGSSGGPGSGSGGKSGGGSGNRAVVTTTGCENTDPNRGCNPCPAGLPLRRARNPASCLAFEHNLFCSQLNPTGLSYQKWEQTLAAFDCKDNNYVPGSPAVAAENAFKSIRFPKPSGDRSPSPSLTYQGYPFTYVNLWTFYWTGPDTWKTLTATATDKDQSATVTARPVELDFDPGDGGSSVACDGPGRPWVQSDGNAAPTDGACAYQYAKVTSGPITSTQTIVWRITWTGTGGSAGEIPSLSTSVSGQLQVLQVQVVNR